VTNPQGADLSAGKPTHPGRVIAAAAILVTAPRLALTFLSADGILVPPGIRIALLALTSVATAIALTGGAAYLSLVVGREVRGRLALVVFWAASVLCSSALIAPGIVASLPTSALAGVLPERTYQWIWSICAVAAVDLIAAGAMRADAREGAARVAAQESADRVTSELEAQRDEARAELRAARQELERLRAGGPPAASAASKGALLTCSRCGSTGFESRKALNGHRRWCRPGDATPVLPTVHDAASPGLDAVLLLPAPAPAPEDP
jgi:MFS family permease